MDQVVSPLLGQGVLGICCVALAFALATIYQRAQQREDALRAENGEALRRAQAREDALRGELTAAQEKRVLDAHTLVRSMIESQDRISQQIERMATAVAESAETDRATVGALARFEGRLPRAAGS